MPRVARLSRKGLLEDARRLYRGARGTKGSVTPHALLGKFHSDTDIASPAEGAMVLADDTPEWNILLHPAAAGYAMVTDATTWTIDQTPTWTGDHTWDDDDGDSPKLHLIPENNDDWQIWAENNATPGDSDLIIKFPAADTDALILFRDSGDNDVAHIDGDGNTTWDGAAHRFGIADTTGTILTLSGDAAGDEGGQLSIELSGAHDGVFNAWNIDVYQDDLRFFTQGAAVINTMTAEGQLKIPTAGVGAGVLIGGDAQWYRSAANVMATPDDLYLAGAGLGIIHVDGVAAGAILVANGTRYIPGTIADAGGAPNDAQYVTMALDGDLSAERVLTGGNSISLVDGGANGNATLNLDTPGTLTVATVNNATAPHLHTVTSSSNPGAAASILASNAPGALQLLRFGIGAIAGADNTIRVVDDTWIGLSSATGRIVFDDTPSPDQIDIANADLNIATTAHGIIHVDGVAAGAILVANGTRYVPGTIADAGGAPNDAQYVVMALDGDLSAERVLTAGDSLTLTDGGANGNATLDLDTPGTLTVATVNNATAPHLHTITSSANPGAAASILASDAAGALQLVRFGIGAIAGVDNTVAVVDGTWMGFTAAAGRVVWNSTAAPDQIEITNADLDIATSGLGIVHADGVTAGWLLVANGTRYVPANPAASLPIAPGDRGHIIRGEAGPVWASYNADTLGAVLIGDGTDIISDTSPTFVDDITLDKNGGNSPLLHFITVSNDEIKLLADDTFGDFRILLSEAAGVSSLLVEDSAGAQQFAVTSDGDATVTGTLTVPQYIIHALDPDTYIDFTADQIALRAGGVDLLTLTEAATNTILFGAQADLNGNDLIIDTDGDTYLHESADDVISIAIAGNAQYQLDATQLTISTAAPAAVLYIRTAGDVAATSADIYEANALGLAAANSVHVFVDANDGGTDAYFAVHMDAENLGDANIEELWRVTETNEMMMRKAGVVHGATDIVRTTDTFYQVSNVSATAGGALITGARDSTDAAGGSLVLRGLLDENADTTKTTSGRAIVELYGGQSTGTGWDNVVADGNVVAFRTRASGAWATRFIFDTEGSAHADIEWTTFDDHDDVALLDALESSFGEFAEDHQADLERLKIATYDGTPGHAMVNFSRLAMLHTGAIRQMSQRLERYEKALLELGANPALLGA